jgi:hypothetical protein
LKNRVLVLQIFLNLDNPDIFSEIKESESLRN